ncbi:MAG TPA: endonuclease domain-containing protein, partial [Flavisolibacter sp.]|nr:endonuclease domain-containing protein [Flavisolibacter sp.]
MSNMQNKYFEERLKQYAGELAPVVPFVPTDKLLLMDFTGKNEELTDAVLNDTNLFIKYINRKLSEAGAKYGIGGYDENRVIYRRSTVFDAAKGLSSTTSLLRQDGAKALSRWEGDEHPASFAEEDTVGCRHADPHLYGLLKNYALENRGAPTPAEAMLWEALKTQRLSAYKFRRQHIIDRFITDFVCLKKRLVIEVDGLIHQLPENKESDEQRTIA